jgi:uncharacterized protein
LVAAAAFIARPAHADLFSAETAYSKRDFATAFAQFKELAELGQPVAQYDLAVMYAKGEGIEQSNTLAHAWASLAGANGAAGGADLAAKLAPLLTPTSLEISADIQAKYGQAALNTRLLPNLFRGREYQDRDPVRPFQSFMPQYPRLAQVKGVQGEVFVEFTVAADGHPRIPRILYAIPSGYFEDAVRDSVMRSIYLPARINGTPVSTSVSRFYNFVVAGVGIADYGNLGERVRLTQAKAEAGDPSAQMLYGMMLAGLPQLHQTYDTALPWFVKAAQAGAPYAEYQVGTGLLQGHGCQCDTRKGEIWLQKAAQADQPDAQVSLAEYLLKDSSNRESVTGAVVWLTRAADHGNSTAKLMLAAVLAASPAEGVIDPARALMLSDNIEREYRHDPSLWEIRAAAYASRGDYDPALKAQSQALKEAANLGWDLTLLNRRQTLYASRQTWSGNLLQF